MAYLREMMPQTNVLLHKYIDIRFSFQELSIILKVDNLQIADQVKQNTR